MFSWRKSLFLPRPYHSAAQDRLASEAKQGWAGQYQDVRPPGKTRLLFEEVLVRPAGGAHPVVCVGPNRGDSDTILSKSNVFRMRR